MPIFFISSHFMCKKGQHLWSTNAAQTVGSYFVLISLWFSTLTRQKSKLLFN